MNKLIKTFACLTIAYLLMSTTSFAQRGEGGMRRDPAQMVAVEKKLVFDSLTTLNENQKLIIEQIYKDYAQAFTAARADADPNNREAMITKMRIIRDNKNESLKAILTEVQYSQYDGIMKARRQGRRRTNDK